MWHGPLPKVGRCQICGCYCKALQALPIQVPSHDESALNSCSAGLNGCGWQAALVPTFQDAGKGSLSRIEEPWLALLCCMKGAVVEMS